VPGWISALALGGAALLIGGIGYAYGKEWGRRLADAVLWCAAMATTVLLIILARELSLNTLSGAFLLSYLFWWRLELWQPDVLRMCGKGEIASPGLRRVLLRRMVAASVSVALAAAFAGR
jgi:hypothetical protein